MFHIRMKKAIYILLALLLAACSDSGDNVVLTGNIKGLGNDTIYIYGADALYPNVDTIFARRGKFKKQVQADTLLQTWLFFSNGYQHPVFMNKRDRISIKGSAADLEHLNVSGTDDNELLSAFLADTTDTAPMADRVEAFVKENPASPAGIYLLQRYVAYADQPDEQKVSDIIKLMDDRLHDWNAVRTLQERSDEILGMHIGRQALFFRAPIGGSTKTLSSYNGKYLLLHFWASWDRASLGSLPDYRKLYKDSQKKGSELKDLAMLGVSLDMVKPTWRSIIEADSLEWDQTCDFKGWNSTIVTQYAVRHLPSDVLISPDGKVIGIDLLSSQAIEDKIKEAKEETDSKK